MRKRIPLKLIIGTVSNEKGVSADIVFNAVEAALVSASKKKYGLDIEIRVDIDRKSGMYDTHRIWTVVSDPEPSQSLEFPLCQMTLSVARLNEPAIQPGEIVLEPLESVDFGRIAAQSAKHVIVQKIREAEKNLIADEYIGKIGELITGIVKKITRDSVILDLTNNAEGVLLKSDTLSRDIFRQGDRVRAYLSEVQMDARGPQMILSRTCIEMLRELFKIEVPEVGEGIIEIKAIAREPGLRAKIAVKTNDGRMDPIGACVGMRGSRVQAVSNELCGERVDVILWNENSAQFVLNAMAPAELVSIVLDEETRVVDIAVKEECLSQAIGRGGQNVKLASDLTGWDLNIISDKEALNKEQQEEERLKNIFVKELDINENVAEVLVTEGFAALEEIAYVPIQELLDVEDFDIEVVDKLRTRAKAKLLTNAIAKEVVLNDKMTGKDIFQVDGMTRQLAYALAQKGVMSRDALAELSVDDLLDITELDDEKAGRLIMTARAHWFATGK